MSEPGSKGDIALQYSTISYDLECSGDCLKYLFEMQQSHVELQE